MCELCSVNAGRREAGSSQGRGLPQMTHSGVWAAALGIFKCLTPYLQLKNI